MQTFYNQERLFVSPTNTSFAELYRVQSVSSSFSTRNAISTEIGGNKTYTTNVHDLISAALTIDYLGYEAYNEGIMGFSGDFAGKMVSGNDLRNYNIQISGGGTINATGAVLTNYSISTSVGEFPRHSATFDVFEMGFWTGTSITTANPLSIGTSMAAIIPGNIDAQFSGGCGILSFHIQDVNLSIAVGRDYTTYAGYKLPSVKRATFPMEAKVTMSAIFESFATGDINTYFSTTSGVDLRVIYKNKQGVNTNGGFRLSNAYLTSQEISNETMNRTRLSLEFSCNLGIVNSKNAPKGSLYIGI
jgi:hypothetical protein